MATIRTGDRAVLVVVDVQVDVMKGCWQADRVVANVARVVEQARARGVPVLWVQHEDADMPRESAGWQWVPALAPRDDEPRVFKRYNSSFEDTTLEAELAALGATRLVLAGAMTNWCIRATSYGALDRGYDLVLVKDAHTTSDVDLGDGRVVSAGSMVDDLNVAMTWTQYPGRGTTTAAAADMTFE